MIQHLVGFHSTNGLALIAQRTFGSVFHAAYDTHVSRVLPPPNHAQTHIQYTETCTNSFSLSSNMAELIFDFRDHLDGNESDEPDESSSEDEVMTEIEQVPSTVSDDEMNAETEMLQHNSDEMLKDRDIDEQEESEEDLAFLEPEPLGDETSQRVRRVLRCMDHVGIKVVDFLDGLSWGTQATTVSPKIQRERTLLLSNPRLQNIIQRWAKPPRSLTSHKKRPEGASTIINTFATSHVHTAASNELEKLASSLLSPTSHDISEQTLLGTTFSYIGSQAQEKAPSLWNLLQTLACHPTKPVHSLSDHSRSRMERVIVTIISILSYQRSHSRCRLQKLMSICLKFKGISAKGFDILHALRLTMSHKWTTNSVERISKSCMADVVKKKDVYPWMISYDNINISFRVFSQRLDNQSELGSGTASTVYIRPGLPLLPATINQNLRTTRAQGLQKPLTELEVTDILHNTYPKIQAYSTFQVLQFLIHSPEFDLATYEGRTSPRFKRRPWIRQLSAGPRSETLQFILGTSNVPEVTHEQHDRLVNEWLDDLGWGDSAKQSRGGKKWNVRREKSAKFR
ncbi:hypothetical protein NP233_g8726 [Leucocoprinus birnbaumii]|uniref:DUF6589 domain-containing protein n=1 Tax=Leucocoprinus birnbaumii TaxID=56174 RepID=A0AAD5YTG4_9AGAR|nr:hypothetical protein NP233_g8726 [Leucocoprinus birnbaumii]